MLTSTSKLILTPTLTRVWSGLFERGLGLGMVLGGLWYVSRTDARADIAVPGESAGPRALCQDQDIPALVPAVGAPDRQHRCRMVSDPISLVGVGTEC